MRQRTKKGNKYDKAKNNKKEQKNQQQTNRGNKVNKKEEQLKGATKHESEAFSKSRG